MTRSTTAQCRANLNTTASEQIPAPSIFGEPTKTLSVVVPAYNEEERLAPMLEEMLAFLQKRRDRQVCAGSGSGFGEGLGCNPDMSAAYETHTCTGSQIGLGCDYSATRLAGSHVLSRSFLTVIS